VKVNSTKDDRKEMINKLLIPFMDETCLTEEDSIEAKIIQQALENTQVEEEQKLQITIETENTSAKEIFAIAFRAILCEHDQQMDLFRPKIGEGYVDWSKSVTDATTDNSILEQNETTMRTNISYNEKINSMTTMKALAHFREEMTKYQWYVSTYLIDSKAKQLIRALEDVIGQFIKTKIIQSTDPTHKMFVIMSKDDSSIVSKKISLYAYFKQKCEEITDRTQTTTESHSLAKPIIAVNHIETLNQSDISKLPDNLKQRMWSVLKLGFTTPISKNPDGSATEETQTETYKKIVQTTYQLNEDIGKYKEQNNKRKTMQDDSPATTGDIIRLINEQQKKSQQKTKLCSFFLRGNCSKGSACTFKHISKEACRDFAKGSCTRGDSCNYNHNQQITDPQQRYQQNTYRQLPPTNASNQRYQPYIRPQQPQLLLQYQPGAQAGARPPQQLRLQYNQQNNQQQQPMQQQQPQQQPQQQNRRQMGPIPIDACNNLKTLGKCEIQGCRGRHGRYNTATDRQCMAERLGKMCNYLFAPGGCTMLHTNIKN
jgi:hypothetical protein